MTKPDIDRITIDLLKDRMRGASLEERIEDRKESNDYNRRIYEAAFKELDEEVKEGEKMPQDVIPPIKGSWLEVALLQEGEIVKAKVWALLE